MSSKLYHSSIWLVVFLATGAHSAFAKSEITAPVARSAFLNELDRNIQAFVYRNALTDSADKNPFSPRREVIPEVVPSRRGTDQELLSQLASQLNPTGVLAVGDQALLLFGEKKVKVGEFIVIPFDKDSYDVELIALTRTTFTVRLNQAEITRSIKPAKQP